MRTAISRIHTGIRSRTSASLSGLQPVLWLLFSRPASYSLCLFMIFLPRIMKRWRTRIVVSFRNNCYDSFRIAAAGWLHASWIFSAHIPITPVILLFFCVSLVSVYDKNGSAQLRSAFHAFVTSSTLLPDCQCHRRATSDLFPFVQRKSSEWDLPS